MSKELKKMLKLGTLFLALFVLNMLFLKWLSVIGFVIHFSEISYLVPPLFSVIVLSMIEKKRSMKTVKHRIKWTVKKS
ncbi:Uncharacterised protein [Streptococcus suis]|uniref:Uncharacterized protein n=1 Tax=Streptococcus suis TaxID=1307 RepID=A0A123U932_STRSU|nr:Uncharacterised protein [Streptococcus suis]CYW13342.1 Uncharacterised protein [Streptococcus suis]